MDDRELADHLEEAAAQVREEMKASRDPSVEMSPGTAIKLLQLFGPMLGRLADILKNRGGSDDE